MSARWMVESLCATTIVVRCLVWSIVSMASCNSHSLRASKALVGSSSRSTAGSRTKALAIAIRCFCPPLSRAPRSPTWEWYPRGSADTKSCAPANFAALTTSSSEAPWRPYRMFSSTGPSNNAGSCGTSAV
mmetsp:Transcript_128511/g.320498  ORF Transcript_128511/g.320498 Transcript_128511/m.320498 type:complete len:131 (+) Transcript_128511:236-628(+)